ncbi:hypothetical protein [Streptomyces sp. NPDC051286]|uniref:hypothetical protein n=1 Tax=Streptomyces sp. NPDC051286 TaxID=3365647 RepID=UPI00379454D2
MTKARFSHAACEHPSTKAGRAGCRKAMRDAAMGKTTESAAKAAAPKAGVAQAESAPAEGTQIVSTPAAEPIEVTRETWKDNKGKAASVYVKGVEEPFAAQGVTGWSIKFLQFTDADGKRQQIPASTVERVTV